MNKIILSYPSGYTQTYLKGVLLPLNLAHLLFLYAAKIYSQMHIAILERSIITNNKAWTDESVLGERTVNKLQSKIEHVYEIIKSY